MRVLATTIGTAALAIATAATPLSAAAQATPDDKAFLSLYKELVETNTVVNVGSCTQAAAQIATRMKAAGYRDDEITLFSTPDHPKDGGIVVVAKGSDPALKPILLLAHLDVVEAKRADWVRDPFKLIEENGNYYGRGTVDDKGMAAIWADTLIRFRQAGYTPKRTVKMALTCGEETTYAFNGAEWLAKNRPDLIAAEFAINEGGGGDTDGKGKILTQSMQVGEKSNRSFELTATNPGGHSSLPVDDNAIYELADAIGKVRATKFPIHFNDTTKAFFARAGAARGDDLGRAMMRLSADPSDKAAEAMVVSDRTYNSMLRTTCVATMLAAGHAVNALPQRAVATVNCRIAPGEDADTTKATLEKAIADPKIAVALVGRLRPVAVVPPLTPKIMAPAEALVKRYFPGVPLIPIMSTGATDATYMTGIPTYGVPGPWGDPDGNGAHGLNERHAVKSAYVARDFLTDLVKAYADGR